MSEWTPEVVEALEASGWEPGRRVDTDRWRAMCDWGESLGRRLFPLGELDHGRFFLAIDEAAEIYLVEAWLASFGLAPRALENLVRGVAPRRIEVG
ncbi:SUKH-3 domain-containing protein [Streptomyces sp. NPDC090119]|uniref:SUKH-3 domain-containing protein n=1 Tax=Streptomyces sp. NPDC090119 TaxID=3365951 RepID=UPI00381CA31E